MKNKTKMLAALLKRFRSDKSGNVMMLFGLAVVPILGLTGVAVDYARATTARTALHAAIDSAALMAARDATKLTDAELRTRINGWIRANLSGDSATAFTEASISIDRAARTINIAADFDVPTTLTRLISQNAIKVASSSQSTWGSNTIELALALDNTGSMASSGKMTALKQASLDLLKIMKDAANEPDQIKVSIVPFNTQVKLDSNTYKNETWLRYDMTRKVNCDWSGKNCTTETMSKAKWTASGEGCIFDRDQNYDTTDGEVIDTNEKRYPAYWCSQTSLTTIRPLTNDWTALTNTVNAMTPVGNTNVTIGAVWGMATLSPSSPFTEAKPANTPRLKKYMILLTDGDNTENRFGGNSGDAIDARTKLACTNIKAMGVKLYTIRVINGDADLLRNCASETSMYYDVQNASQLSPVFKQIASEISAVRLSM